MNDRGPAEEQASHQGQLALMLRVLYQSSVARVLLWLSGGIVLMIAITAFGQIRLNQWNKPFYDALSRRDFHDFLYQLGVFFLIAGLLLVFNVGQRWLVETLKLRLREALVRDLVGHWLVPRRAFWLAHAGPMGVNPDQRLHDDARKLCELSADLGIGLLQAVILFCSFAGVLWALSSGFTIRYLGDDYEVPGFMLWAAILYAGLGSHLSDRVGVSLVARNAERYAREGDLRFSMVRINEHLDGISLAEGEADEERRVHFDLAEVLDSTRRLVLSLTHLTWVTAGFGWITIIAPVLVAAPLYFSGKISFGGLMMAAAAFTQAQSSLRWYVDSFSTIADWRATMLRVMGFRQALTAVDGSHPREGRIVYDVGEPGQIAVDGLEIECPTGRDRIREREWTVQKGQRVLIVGAPGTATTPLFRALTGLWPWGSGRITRPRGEQILYVPRGTPYMPRGTLREVLAYPLKAGSFREPAFAKALGLLGLERLAPLLDVTRKWERELSQDEQLRLAFARVALQRPPWVIIDDAFSALDNDALWRVIGLFSTEMARSGVIHVGRAVEGRDPLFPRVLHLVKVDARADGGASNDASAPSAALSAGARP